MATYRKPLKDIDGNFIIPAMTGDETGWIQTGDLADNSVTKAKLNMSTMNPFAIPWDSTNGSWFTATSGTAGNDISLGVDVTGNNHGLWDGYTNSWMIYNDGTYTYVNGIRIDAYRIKQYLFTVFGGTEVEARADLNSPTYCATGMYYCPTSAAGALLQNNPSGTAFSLEVRASWDTRVEFSGAWCYKTRIMYALNGVWYQEVHTNASGTPVYNTWKQLHNA